MTRSNRYRLAANARLLPTARIALAFVLLLAAPFSPVRAQEIGDPWLESLRGATGTVIGDLTPRFGGGTPTAGETGAGAGVVAETTPDSIDPSDPKAGNLIREWISIAEPPQNVTEGARFHYTYGGNMVGTTADGGIITAPHETGAFDAVFLWQNRRRLDSVNHCTMEEYVVARLTSQPVDHCRGRYKPGSPVAGSGSSVSDDNTDRIDQALATCKFKEAKALIEAIDPGPARRSLVQRYDEAFGREEKTKALFGAADAAFRNCKFDNAKANLTAAAANTACERYSIKIAQAQIKVAAAAAHEQKTKKLFSDADLFFNQNHYKSARDRLNAARAHTKCKRYVTRIDQALEKVAGRIAQAAPSAPTPDRAPQPVAPTVPRSQDPPRSSDIPSGSDYFVGVWAFSQAACSGHYKPKPSRDRGTAGSIAGAIEQGIEQGLEKAIYALVYEFRSDGIFYVRDVRQPNSRFIAYADWSYQDNTLTFRTHDDGETDHARIRRKLPDRFELDSEIEGEQALFHRCPGSAN